MSEQSDVSTRENKTTKRDTTTTELIQRLHEQIGHAQPLSLTHHLSAGRKLCRLRDRLAHGERPTQRALVALLCSGIATHRRWAVGECAGGTADDELIVGAQASGPRDEAAEQRAADNARDLVHATAVRIFVLLCMVEAQKRVTQLERGVAALDTDDESRKAIAAVGLGSLWETIKDPPLPIKNRRRVLGKLSEGNGNVELSDEIEDVEEEQVDPREAELPDRRDEVRIEEQVEAHRDWEAALRVTSGEVARHTLRIGAGCLDDESWSALDGLMPLFFRNSAFNMAQSLLMPDGDVDFVSLGVARPMAEMGIEQREKKLLAIAQAGESEAGQQVVRDMMLSFLLPSSHVGMRRTLLLARAASTRAGVDYPEHVARSHDVAMAGTEWLWVNGTDPLERMCCILAGMAVMTTKGGDDPMRKTDAFCGRVQLPFFETRQPKPEHVRIVLIPSSRRWVLYSLNKRGMPKVLCSQRGFQGLCDAALQLIASLR